jgi:very-short-patch-repair endonuclease
MAGGYRLPTEAQKLFAQAGTRPDFVYAADSVVIYVDGPPHDFSDRQQRDAAKQAAMEDLGYIVLRFRHDAEWALLFKKYPSVFGSGA